jgi:hypothetical protein
MDEETAFANADYACFGSHLATNPGIFRSYRHSIHPRNPQEFAGTLLGYGGGKRLFHMRCGLGEYVLYFAIGPNTSRRTQ